MKNHNADAEVLAKYPFIAKWGQELGSYQYYITNQCYLAQTDNAPSNAIYKRDDKWVTTDEITNPDIIKSWNLAPAS